jgi:hypothetical protein
MIVLEGDDRQLYKLVHEKNLFRQYDLLTNCIEIGLKQGHTAFDKYTVWALNHVAVANIFSIRRPLPRRADLCRRSSSTALQRAPRTTSGFRVRRHRAAFAAR